MCTCVRVCVSCGENWGEGGQREEEMCRFEEIYQQERVVQSGEKRV